MLAKATLKIIETYQKFISPALGQKCRFYPTCSQYAFGAIGKYGFLKGGFLGIKRILKCNPYHIGGVDEIKLKSKN